MTAKLSWEPNERTRWTYLCPTCEREFKELRDYPRVFIASVSVITPDEVPAEIPNNLYREDLLEAPNERLKRNLVPSEVLAYFLDHPDQYKLVHGDDYIYFRPVNLGRHSRQFNYARMIKMMLTDEMWQKYLESLQQKVGQEVPTEEILDYIDIGRFRIGLAEGQVLPECRVAKIVIFEEKPGAARYGSPLFRMIFPVGIGTINYEGRLNQP